MTKTAKIREIFKSIQGEGTYVGTRQVFVRFCTCNLNCNYCDTDFEASKSQTYTPQELLEEVERLNPEHPAIISLTGGEPLMSVEFLEEFLPLAKKHEHKIYLETNGTLPEKLLQIVNLVDVVSADIKLKSSTGMEFDPHILEKFFEISANKEVFAKIVFDKNITDEEIKTAVELAKRFDFEIILQPMMIEDKMSVSVAFCEEIFDKIYSKYQKVRLIPQVHKFLNVR